MKSVPISAASRRPKRKPMPPEFVPPLTPCNLPIRRCTVPREQAVQRILIMRIGAFGDILMGTSLLAALRTAYPDAYITWVAEYSEREAIDANPYVDEVLRWDGSYWRRMVRRFNYGRWVSRMLAFRRELRDRRYDIFISFQPEEWPLLTLGVAAPVSIGIFDTFKRFYGKAHNPHFRRFYTHVYDAPDLATHRIDQYLLTLEALGLPPNPASPMSMGYTEADRAAANQFLAEQGVTAGERLVVLAPMTTWPTKCWSSERYAELGDALVEQHGCRIVVIGSGKEREAVEALASQMKPRPVTAAGSLTFRQMAALIDQAALLVSGDTGPMHVASALGIPQIALFGATSPQWYGPRSKHALSLLHEVPCGPCDQKVCANTGADYLRCLKLITVEEALTAAQKLLSAKQKSAGD